MPGFQRGILGSADSKQALQPTEEKRLDDGIPSTVSPVRSVSVATPMQATVRCHVHPRHLRIMLAALARPFCNYDRQLVDRVTPKRHVVAAGIWPHHAVQPVTDGERDNGFEPSVFCLGSRRVALTPIPLTRFTIHEGPGSVNKGWWAATLEQRERRTPKGGPPRRLAMDHELVVGASGLEPPTSASRTLRANQTALRPVPVDYSRSAGRTQGQPGFAVRKRPGESRARLLNRAPDRATLAGETKVGPRCKSH